ncbi:DnaB-like helicase C-terminal domain-containing protein [Borreliella bavariensis]|uniref:DnaB-like helicase C-terminal domain-containing protein n=1 Tax=Borreliella bavariensis TaxID=664662 RepID=UPI001C02CA92|nr:DnaB-like helicase C-terminal domain-containing protein [Borreliella bavariensis]
MQNCVNSKDILVDNVQNNANSLEFSYKNKNLLSAREVLKNMKNRNFTENGRIKIGFSGLDKIIKGFKKSNFVVIGSKTSVGKSAFALNIVNNLCQQNRSVGFFSLEVSNKSIAARLMAMNSEVESYKICNNILMDDNERLRCDKAFSKIKNFKMRVDDTCDIDIHELKSKARKMKKDYGVEIIFIDRIDLISTLHNNIPRFEEIADLSRNIRALTLELEIPIIVLCPLYWYDEDREPSLADLAEMESLEQDADMVILLHRENEEQQDNEEEVRKIKVIVAKNRCGAIGTATIGFEPKYTKFMDVGVG